MKIPSLMPRRKTARNSRGTALIEFSMVFPFLLVLTLTVIDLSRARAVRPRVAGERETTIDLTAERHVDEALDRLVRSWEVEEALRKIGEEHRVALVEVHYKGRPYADVAHDLGVPPGTVKSTA